MNKRTVVVVVVPGPAGCSSLPTIMIGAPSGAANNIESSAKRGTEIFNRSGDTIWTLSTAPEGTNAWGERDLNALAFRNGASVTLDIASGSANCMYDIKADYAEGRTLIRRGVNACTLNVYNFR